jgi:Ca-activated chloride channel homolog
MDLQAKLDVDGVAVQAEDEVTALLVLTAPVPADVQDRPGETLVAVVDRSGSMRGGRLASVRTALHALVDRLKPQDVFGVVVFDTEAVVQVPTRRMDQHDVAVVHQLLEAIHSGSSTDLSAGYLLGLSEARRHLGPTGATVLLLSDGYANAGILEPDPLGALADQAREDRVTTSTIGIGDGYSEGLLSLLATRGAGSHRFALTDDDAIAVVSEEAGDLLNKSIVNAVLRVRPVVDGLIDRVATFQSLPRWTETDPDGVPVLVIALGDLYSGERREVLLRIDVPALAALGVQHLADLAIGYVALPELAEQTITWPLSVNVVPGDEAAGRIPDPSVVTARLLAETTQAKQKAVEALHARDIDGAVEALTEQAKKVRSRLDALDPNEPGLSELRDRLTEEEAHLTKLARGAEARPVAYSSKSIMEDVAMEFTGRTDPERRKRSRDKRDF